MQNDKDSSAMTPEAPRGDNAADERDRDGATRDGGPVSDADLLKDTGQGQGQSRGKPQVQPQE